MLTGICLVMPPPVTVATPAKFPAHREAVDAVWEMVADPPGGIVTVSPDVATSQLMLSCHVTVRGAAEVFVMVTPAVTFGPPTMPEYCRLGGETKNPVVEEFV